MASKFQRLVEKRAIDTTLVEFAPIVATIARSAVKGAASGAASETAKAWINSQGNIDKK